MQVDDYYKVMGNLKRVSRLLGVMWYDKYVNYATTGCRMWFYKDYMEKLSILDPVELALVNDAYTLYLHVNAVVEIGKYYKFKHFQSIINNKAKVFCEGRNNRFFSLRIKENKLELISEQINFVFKIEYRPDKDDVLCSCRGVEKNIYQILAVIYIDILLLPENKHDDFDMFI
jgi:hypothetical protein